MNRPGFAAGSEKKRLAARAKWHFGGGRAYCDGCRRSGLSCATGQPGADGKLCPYREHAPLSEAGWQAWDVALRCAGQLRMAPNGYPLGLDLTAAFTVGAALGYDARGLAEFLPDIETGMAAGIKTEIDRLRSDA